MGTTSSNEPVTVTIGADGTLPVPGELLTGPLATAVRFDLIVTDGAALLRACPHLPDSSGRYPCGHDDVTGPVTCGMVKVTCANTACGRWRIVGHDDMFVAGWVEVNVCDAGRDVTATAAFCSLACAATHLSTNDDLPPWPTPPPQVVQATVADVDVAVVVPAGTTIAFEVTEADGSTGLVDVTDQAAHLIGRSHQQPSPTPAGSGSEGSEVPFGTLAWPDETMVVVDGTVVDVTEAMAAVGAGLVAVLTEAANRAPAATVDEDT